VQSHLSTSVHSEALSPAEICSPCYHRRHDVETSPCEDGKRAAEPRGGSGQSSAAGVGEITQTLASQQQI